MKHGAVFPAIRDYALIGNCRTAALVSSRGSIDWLCLPRFDSPSVFGAVLDPQKGGRFQIGPDHDADLEVVRRYLPDTNVLETTFRSSSGTVTLTDFMPVASPQHQRTTLWPDHEILRIVECRDGEMPLEILCDPKPDYARRTARVRSMGRYGWCFTDDRQPLTMLSTIDMQPRDGRLYARRTIRAGERWAFSLCSNDQFPAVIPPLGDHALDRLNISTRWWEQWSKKCRYHGRYREHVLRSALALKLMVFAPSGAVIAAPTTSLPEWPGGERNYDYRYCWLRDATLVTRSLLSIGYETEAFAFLDWLLHATRLTAPRLQVLYDVFGESRIPESELEHLSGYADSRPVRIGNAAADQLQLDVYGAVIGAAHDCMATSDVLTREQKRLLTGMARIICEMWRQTDEGIWEIRTDRRHHTHSKFMCWFGLDRLIDLHENRHIDGPVERFREDREAIAKAIEERGYSTDMTSYVQEFGGRTLDASLLQMLFLGYEKATSRQRLIDTCHRVHESLGRNGLLYRYRGIDDGLAGEEGAFGVCSFWGAQAFAALGEREEAAKRFEHVCSFANDLGLFAEEINPDTGEHLGNFPQAFTHVGLINAAIAIDEGSAS